MDGDSIDPATWSIEDLPDYMEIQPASATDTALLRPSVQSRDLPGP